MTMEVVIDPTFDNSGQQPLNVPGHGLPINYMPGGSSSRDDKGRFRHGADDFKPERMVVREVAMLQLGNEITEKPDWENKVFNDEIVAKWKVEALQNPNLTEALFDWTLRELREKSEFSSQNRFTTVLENASVCVKSERLVPEELKQELKEATQALLDLPCPDWHPHSNEQVRNLVHPSLFPLVYGRSRVLKSGTVGVADCLDHIGQTESTSVLGDPFDDPPIRSDKTALWSRKFQWLPCEVKFDGISGTDVKITSYINNLHPVKYSAIYEAVEKLIALSVRPWDEVLVYGNRGKYPMRIKTYGVNSSIEDEPDWISNIGDLNPIPQEIWGKIHTFMASPEGPHYDPDRERWYEKIPDNWEELSGYALRSAINAKINRKRAFALPEPGQTYEEWRAGNVKPVVKGAMEEDLQHKFYKVDLENDFRDRGLQVIVKIAGIELSPESPSYPGGNWHLEGMINEHIVATSIYYYDVENITDSGIRFRQEATLSLWHLVYTQHDHKPLETVFGTSLTDAAAVQEIGQIKTTDGRFVAFPNTLQHCVQPFELKDKTKPGHRRFVVLWLVDPHYRVMSTANVPPQQHEWWAEEVRQKSGIDMPPEVMNMVMENVKDWPMGLDEAKEIRLDLMKERTAFGQEVEWSMEQYFLCEH